MEEIKEEILLIIKLFKLGTFQGSRTIDVNFLGIYTETEFWTEKGVFKHEKLNK